MVKEYCGEIILQVNGSLYFASLTAVALNSWVVCVGVVDFVD